MKLNDFTGALYAAGWRATSDAQYTNIAKLHKKLFPVVAELESELEDAKYELEEAVECGHD